MQGLLRWWASVRGFDVAPNADLRLELSAFPAGGEGLLVLAALLAVVALVIAIYRRDGRTLTRGRRTVLAALRLGAVLIAALLLLEPSLVAVERESRPGEVILLVDDSQSMTQHDGFRRAPVAPLAEAWSKLGVDPRGSSRLDLARALLSGPDGGLPAALAAHNDVAAYAFGDGLQPLPWQERSADDTPNQTPPHLQVEGLKGDRPRTDLGNAVRGALERSHDGTVAALVVLTDGRRNTGARSEEIARLIAARKIPRTLVLGVGDPSPTQALAIERVEAPAKVFQKDPFRVSVRLAAVGYEPLDVPVRLLRTDVGDGGDEVIATRHATLGGDTTDAVVDFDDLVADSPGVQTYRVDLTPPPGEPQAPERHVRTFRVEALRDQIRVLLIAGGPTHEYRVLKTALTRDKTIELRGWLQSADPAFPQEGNVSITALPASRDEVDQIDVFLLLDPDSSRLTRSFCEQVAAHVLEDGAGLWWVAGEKFTLEALREGASTRPLADLLPVVPDLTMADRRWIGYGHAFEQAWPWRLTTEGRRDPVTRTVDDVEANAAAWQRLPGYHFAFPIASTKPLARSLVALTDPRLSPAGQERPLLAVQNVGAGRVLFTGTDETYRWRATAEQLYQRLWVKGIRHLHEARLTAGGHLRLAVSEERVELGDAVEIRARVTDAQPKPLTAEIRRGTDLVDHVELEPIAGSDNELRGVWRPTSLGVHAIVAKLADTESRVELEVVPAAIEDPGPVDLVELQALAAAPGAELLRTPQELLAAARDVPSRRAVDVYRTAHPVWDSLATVSIIVLLLTIEWLLRKRWNLL